ncbi:MAG: peptidoglycan editing factor PgeF [Alphaproteobacteria bacterium]
MNDNVKYYSETTFVRDEEDDVFHGFFTRKGGRSNASFSGLNCGLGSEDDDDIISYNRSLVSQHSGLESESNLLSLYQVHGAKVVCVKEPWAHSERPKADGFVTDVAGMGLGVLTADCAPVLFWGRKDGGDPVIGAAHAGWKGAVGGVLGNVVTEMETLGANKDTIYACVGPCISKSSYEVSSEFIEPFIDENSESERFFFGGSKDGHLMFDLSGYCAWRLFRAGLKNISLLDKDTYSNEPEFFSYRRSIHRNEPGYGRQISVIIINK